MEVLRTLADVLDLPREILGVAPIPQPNPTPPRNLIPRPRIPDQGFAGPPPAQLPSDIRGFAGRSHELEQLDAILGSPRTQPTAVAIAAISGTAGVGKTALAVHWAHRIRGRFPDGQLYIDLRGFHPSSDSIAPSDALRSFLHALHVPSEHIPLELDAQAAMYRSLLDSRRLLVLLDNARNYNQIRPLLPGTGGCLAIVTSRDSLAGLISREDATAITLDLLTDSDARRLLEHRLGPVRIAAEPEAVDRLIQACVNLPLALAMVAARAASHRHFTLGALAAELRDRHGRLDALADEVPDLRAVFHWSYAKLGVPAARLFRLLGLHPGPAISVAASASLGGIPIDQTRAALRELCRASLVIEHSPGRYGFHDLLRAFAADLARANESDGNRSRAMRRMLDHYLHTAFIADRHLRPSREPISLMPALVGTTLTRLTSSEEVLNWFNTEHAVQLAIFDLAAASGLDVHVWQLAWTLDTFHIRQGHWQDGAAAWSKALDATQRLSDQRAQALAHRGIGIAYTEVGRYAEAHTHLNDAQRLCEALGDVTSRAHAHGSIARAYERQNRYSEALTHVEHALDLFRTAGHEVGQARVLNDIGWYHAMLGNFQNALPPCQEALDIHQRLGNDEGAANAYDSLGYAHHHLGNHDTALACYQQALDRFRALGDRHFEATALHHIGDTQLAAGDHAAAHESWQQALQILDDLDHPDGHIVRSKLDEFAVE